MIFKFFKRKFFRMAILIILFSSFAPCTLFAQLNTSVSGNPANLAASITGPGVSVFNVQYNGSLQAGADFTANNSNLGINSGILLCTGPAVIAAGPNSLNDAGVDMGLSGDTQLSQLSGGSTFDATILEFDFIPQSAVVRFRYVFASEEYPEYVCSEYNDVFGFFISGPGISGALNMATVPGSTMPVAINTVNGGNIGSSGSSSNTCYLGNSGLYVNNSSGNSLEFDGFTTVLEAVATVTPCQTYHLRLAIADVGDGIYDSGVFIESESLSSEPVVEAGPPLSLCSGVTAQLGADPVPGWNYSWAPADGLSSDSISNPVFNMTYNGVADTIIGYVVTATNFTCTLTDTVYITLSPDVDAVLSLGVDSVCTGQPVAVHLNGTVSTSAALNWQFNGATAVNGSGGGPWQLNYMDAGRYVVQVEVSQAGCDILLTDTLLVKPVPAPVLSANPVIGCAPLNIEFTNLSLCNGCSVVSTQWNFGDGTVGTEFTTNKTYEKAGIYDVGLMICSSSGCCSDTTYKDYIKVFPVPEAGFRVMPSAPVTLVEKVLFRDDSRGATVWYWEFGDGATSAESSPLHAFPDTGYYMVRQVVINDEGCADTLVRQVEVDPVSTVWFPNAFSPNNDGVNDHFVIHSDYARDVRWTIFDRWGEEVFIAVGTDAVWNGECKDGRLAAQGVYICRITCRDWQDKRMEFNGRLTLLR